ncbi:uncharacterized protein TNCV_2116331 [Trichonephila clavipes]|nr:uncharacterized protein TNCV_2116331 [Trichonephila clavipes]
MVKRRRHWNPLSELPYPTKGICHGSLVVKVTVSWPVCHEFEPSTDEDPPCRTETHVKSVGAQTSSRWCGMHCSTVFSPEAKSDGKTRGQSDMWGISDLEDEKDFNDNHRDEITDFVQSIPGFQECDE